jgi:hypothetical protein
MRLDVGKIDERIKRLQELRRLATDPEMANLLLECLTGDESEVSSYSAEPPAKPEENGGFRLDSVRANRSTADEPDEFIRDIAANSRR